jgi:hypothetical protein
LFQQLSSACPCHGHQDHSDAAEEHPTATKQETFAPVSLSDSTEADGQQDDPSSGEGEEEGGNATDPHSNARPAGGFGCGW